MPQLIVRPPSKASSTISREDEIPPQPLDPNQHEAQVERIVPVPSSMSHDPIQVDDFPEPKALDPVVAHDPHTLAFHRLPVEVLERYVMRLAPGSLSIPYPQER